MQKKLPLFNPIFPCLLIGIMVFTAPPGWSSSTERFEKQGRTVTGRITSADDGLGFPGVNIIVKGSTVGTVSDADGNYSIEVSSPEAVLVYSAIGYATVEQITGTQSVIDVAMQIDVTSLAEVVVVGYGTVKKTDVTGAIARMSSEEIKAMPVQNALQAMQGRTAGLDITSNARPGEVGTIRIRGARSLAANNDPLYVVDGIPLQSGGLADGIPTAGIEAINPNDIESIDVLKDASATAIYGSRGANGVILITTKKGKTGMAEVSYNGSVYFEKIVDRMEMFNGSEYAEYRRNAFRAYPEGNASRYPTPFPNPVDDKRILGADPYAWESIAAGYTWVDKDNLVPVMRPTTADEEARWGVTEVPVYDGSKVPTTDWTDLVNQTGVTQDHNISLSMGTEKIKTYFSGGYLNQTGTSKGQDYKRYSGRLNIEIKALNWLTFGGSMTASYGIQNFGYAAGGSRGSRTIYEAVKGMLPFAVPYDADGNYIYYPGGDVNIVNPINEDDNVINERNTLRLLGSFFAEANLLKGLRFRMNFGPDFRSYNNGQFQYKESALRGGGAPTSTNFASYNTAQQIAWTLENILFYDRTFSNDHRVGLTLLQSSSMMQEENSNMTATNLPYNSQLWYNLGSTSRGALDRWGSGYSRMNLLSYMARVNYSFKDKYLLTVSGRWDGASVLAPGNKWDFFPSMAIAWKMSEEPFLQNVTWLNELKPRIGLGSTGNSSVRPYTTMGAVLQIPYVFGSTPANGFIPSNPKGAADEQGSIPNPSLSWVRTEQWNFGIDFGVLNDRVTGSIDYYIADTYDLIMDKSVNRVTGYGSIVENIGRTQNKGIEVSLTSVNIDQGDFRWTSNITFSRNDQQIVELQEGPFDNVSRRWFIGRPLQVYYDYKKIGIWQLEDADVMAQFNANGATYKPGDIRVEDVNGDFRIDPTNDYQILGSSYPKWNGGITNTFTYKGVELSAFVYARWGNMIEGGAVDMQGRYASRKVDYWTVDNPTNAYPRADYSNGGVPVHYAAMNYQDGSFVKVRYISLGYTLPRTLIQRAGFNHLKIYTQVLNPFLYAKVDFMDPEISFQNNAANTSGSAISSRSLVFGLNASF